MKVSRPDKLSAYKLPNMESEKDCPALERASSREDQANRFKNDDAEKKADVKVSDIIGNFGPYQIAVVIFAALRAMCCAMDGLSGPFLSPNIKNFQCELCDISKSSTTDQTTYTANITADGTCSMYFGDTTTTRYDLDPSHCYFNSADPIALDRINCNKWSFNNSDNENLMNSLTIEQSLVCDREWLKSLSNSMYFVGATLGLLFWGVISDRYGRKTAYVCSHFVTLIFGFGALFAESMSTYILLRAINAFGMIGELIPRSIQVEIVATEYRFVCSVICQIGWATGIILVPALAYLNPGYRFILSIPVAVTVVMLPWLIWLPESARWLITNQNYTRAQEELRRAARINGKLDDDTDSKIEQFNRQVLREEVGSSHGHKRMGVTRSILAIFTNMHLLKDTLSVFILLFVAEVVYFSLTLNVADLGGSLYINYIISGFSELVSIAFCAILLAYLSRRMCLSLLLLASTVSYLLMALVNVYEESLSMSLILTVNAFGKLTAIGNLMVIILVSQEVFPTVIRQFGTSLCITVGKAGSAVAPFTHELGQIIGQSYCFAMFSVICLTCAIVPFVLSETGSRELPDTVIDVEEGANGGNDAKKSKKRKILPQNSSSKNQIALYGTEHPEKHLQGRNGIANVVMGKTATTDFSSFPGPLGNGLKQQQMIEDPNNNCLEPNTIRRSHDGNDINNVISRPYFESLTIDNRPNAVGSTSNLSSGDTIGTISDQGSTSDISNRDVSK